MTIFHTARLTLTPSTPADAADFMALETDPEVMRYLNGGHAVDHSQDNSHATFLMPRGTEEYVWTARRKAINSFVGWFCLWPEAEKIAELGYRYGVMHGAKDWHLRVQKRLSIGVSKPAFMTAFLPAPWQSTLGHGVSWKKSE